MGKYEKLRQRIIAGEADNNIKFSELCELLVRLGFRERVKGSHYIFSKDGVAEIVNLQPKGSKAKPYQVQQIRSIIKAYGLGGRDVD